MANSNTEEVIDDSRVCRDLRVMRQTVIARQTLGKTVGVVPTMGALHEGHLQLVEESCRQCDETVVTIFVNPTQFAPHEDLDRYPRTLREDLRKLTNPAVTHVFVPSAEQIYPSGFSTYVLPPKVGERYEGSHRPSFFRGVSTVVLKLFQLVPANFAFFGQKDYQQLCVIRAMVRDLNLPLEIVGCPTVRDADGLALSSRNVYLSAAERSVALSIPRALEEVQSRFAAGSCNADSLNQLLRQTLERGGVDEIDYAEVADASDLEPLQGEITQPAVAMIAARVGRTRLIDNCLLQP